MSAAKEPSTRFASRAVRATVSIGCIAATAWWLSKQPAPKLPAATTAWALIALAGALTMVTAGLRGLRWSRILHAGHADHLGVEPYLLTAVGYMGNTVLPARGGDVMRVALLSRRRGIDWKTTTGTLIPERLLDLGTIAVFLVILTIASAGTDDLGPWPGIVAAVAIVTGAGAIAAYEFLRRRGRLSWLADRIRPFSRPSKLLWHRDVGPAVVALSFAIWLMEALIFWCVVRATHDSIPPTSALLVIVLVSVASAIPAAPGFLGTFDAAVIFGLHAAHVPSEVALTTAVLYRLVVFVPITLVGSALLIGRYGGFGSARRTSARPDEPADTEG